MIQFCICPDLYRIMQIPMCLISISYCYIVAIESDTIWGCIGICVWIERLHWIPFHINLLKSFNLEVRLFSYNLWIVWWLHWQVPSPTSSPVLLLCIFLLSFALLFFRSFSFTFFILSSSLHPFLIFVHKKRHSIKGDLSFSRVSLSKRITESILAVILVASRFENQPQSMLLIPNALCWSSQKCNCACAFPAEVQLRLRVTRRSWQK